MTITYSPGDTLESFLASLTADGFPPAPVIMVDNGSTDGAPQAAADAHPHARLVSSGGNVGYGTAANIGERLLDDSLDWVLVCNPDTQATPGAVARLLEAATADPRAGVVGPRILESDGTVYPSARSLPAIRTGIGHALLSGVWPRNPWTRRYQQRDVSTSTEVAEVGWLSGAFLLIRREAFRQIGGFDEDFFMYFEDVDLGRRMTDAGWRNLFAPEAVVTHIGGASTAGAPAAMIRAHHRSAHLYIRKTHPAPAWRPVVWAVGVGLSVRAAFTSRRGRR